MKENIDIRVYGAEHVSMGLRLLCKHLSKMNHIAKDIEKTNVEAYWEPEEKKNAPKEELKKIFDPWHYEFDGFSDAEDKAREVAEHIEAACRAADELTAIILKEKQSRNVMGVRKKSISAGTLTNIEEIREALFYGDGVRIHLSLYVEAVASNTTE